MVTGIPFFANAPAARPVNFNTIQRNTNIAPNTTTPVMTFLPRLVMWVLSSSRFQSFGRLIQRCQIALIGLASDKVLHQRNIAVLNLGRRPVNDEFSFVEHDNPVAYLEGA